VCFEHFIVLCFGADCCAPSRVCVFCVVCCAVFCAGYCASLRVCVRFVQVVVLWCMLIVVRRLIVVLPPARCGGIISTASHVRHHMYTPSHPTPRMVRVNQLRQDGAEE